MSADPDADDEVLDLDAITVYGKPTQRIDQFGLGPVAYLDEAELRRSAQATLGETLSWKPGVSSNFFAAGASRPVIRGFEGYRVRMLQDGIGTLDVSETSPDHGVALEPLLIREIDIHRGPGALLFGNSAIGGAVNARSRLLASEIPDQPLSGAVETRYETVNDGTSAAAYGEVVADQFVFNVIGAARDADDYDISGNARSDIYEAVIQPMTRVPGVGTVPVPNPEGTLPNSFVESVTRGVGVTWFSEALPIRLGAGYTRFDSEYGLPYQFGGDPGELLADSVLDMRHDRYDVDVRVEPGSPWLKAIHFHGGYADYRHVERVRGRGPLFGNFDFDDAIFDQEASEGRIDFFHEPFEWLDGVAGIQGQRQNLDSSYLLVSAVDGAFRQPVQLESEILGFYLLETASFESFTLQTGFRYETQDIDENSLNDTLNRDDESYSVATSLTWRTNAVPWLEELSITPSVSYVERIPSVVERLSFWPNPAILRFQVGGDIGLENRLENEESLGFELGLEARRKNSSLRLNVYHYDYANFVFLEDQPRFFGNLAQYVDVEATFYGFEAEASRWFVLDGGMTLTFTAMSDRVRGHNDTDNRPLPRIPPLRVGGRAELSSRNWAVGFELRHAFEQNRVERGSGELTDVTLLEFETDAYTELNLDATRDFQFDAVTLTAFFRATNLLDEERRIHSSFVKDVAPLPGRSLSVGMRYTF